MSALAHVESLAARDFDGDGNLDLAIGRWNDLLVLFGDGLGGFPIASDLPQPSGHYRGLAAGDLDGDPLGDLVAANRHTDELLVFLSSGDGDFAPALTQPTGKQPMQPYLAHMNGDPFLDVVTPVEGIDMVSISLGDGLGGLEGPATFASGGDRPVAVGVGYFDEGSELDVAVANSRSHELALLLGDGTGQLSAPTAYPLEGEPRAVVVADFDLDSHLDVAVPLEDVDRVAVLFGRGDGGFEPAVELGVGVKPVAAAVADLDNDSAPDLLVLNLDDASVGVLFNDPDDPGQFAVYQTLAGFDDFAGLAAIVVADLNADGVDDVVAGGSGVRAMLSDP